MLDTVVKTTCPRDCYDACGISVVVRDGAIHKVKGDPDHHVTRGKLCQKCAIAYNGAFLDEGQRVAFPLKRIGPKGEGQFQAVSWETAFDDISRRLQVILAGHDARSIIHTHYTGTVSMIAGWFPIRFFNRLGATEVDPDTICNKAGHVVLEHMFGTSLTGFDPRQLRDAKSLLVWGGNPSATAPHMHDDWIRSESVPLIVIDPIAHETAQDADLHLQLKPGSDAALAFGMLHVMAREGALDREFLDAHTVGFELVMPAIEAATPEVTEAKTGVPAALIEEAALLFASGPSLLWLGQGMQRQPRGGNAFRAAVLLSVATGYLGQAGAGFCYMNGAETRGVDDEFLSGPELRKDGGASISHIDLAATLSHPARATALFTWNNNVLASSPAQDKLREALAREDLFTVVVDLFRTDTAAYADYVLPAASFFEFDDLVFPYFNNTMSAQAKAVEPVGEALPNQEIFRRLSLAMGFTEPQLYESDVAMLRRLIAQTSFEGSFDDLKAAGTVELCEPLIQFEELNFATPSGKIEVACESLAEMGQPLVPEAHADQAPEAGWLRVLSPASPWLMNSTYCNDAKIQSRLGTPKVFLAETELARRGLKHGDQVILRNATGALRLEASLSGDVPEGVALVHKGRWLGSSHKDANVNVLNAGLKADVADSTAVHGVLAELVRA
ncbi:molybdopterin-dependent oxidoreductase [Methyloligella sp. 2.7D]|uniref:molybdopterin-containing oxidoreductase family protein n=1 Tax=unclassified Methyloligella TaxID=2625955 RepID=UPI00157DD330|nr:molybdopterin-dependent oxidoreductase [Methyloligella sp. GL2]QKP76532.1 molybdopterin-dependent oxidoreductase [Methyloligella sp. GL2]